MSSLCAYNCKISQFKHVLCYICSVVNKILAHVIWNSFSFHFIQILKMYQHFQNSGCIWRVYLQKPINIKKRKKKRADCRALFFTYSAIWTLNTFCQKKLACPLPRHREFTFYCNKCHCCLWTEADKSILANQHAVFRSGDKATLALSQMAHFMCTFGLEDLQWPLHVCVC